MIVFKKVRMKNFLSIGPKWVELTLDTYGVTSVSGENGAAKSAVCIDSIYYALYGKSFRHANIPRMVNSDRSPSTTPPPYGKNICGDSGISWSRKTARRGS